MPRYTDESKERVRNAVDMVDLVGSRVELRKSGGTSFSGLCPFHDERSPSFSVDAAKKVFHCFGCQEGGDAFTFVQKLDGLDFVGSLEFLADRYKVPLEVAEEDPRAAEKRQRRERLLELLERAATFYVRMLWESEEAEPARKYLAERGLEEAILREFRVGYAPSAWDRLLLTARKARFGDREIYDAGLSQRAEKTGKTYDRFRRRIMFPLADRRGRVLGFGARAMGDDQKPKYLNTSENELFHKGNQLFGADVARAAAAKLGQTLVCEGYTDVIALHQAGMRNAVGIMGTAMTEQQVEALAGLAPTVLLALDADSAGQEAMLRAARVAAGRKLELRVVPLPVGSDPADLVQAQGADAVTKLIGASVPLVRFQVQRALDTADLEGPEGKDRVIDELRPVFAGIPQSVLRQELMGLVASRLDLTDAFVADLLAGPARLPARAPSGGQSDRGGSFDGPRPGNGGPPRAVSQAERIERTFLALCIALPTKGHDALDGVTPEHFASPLLRRAAEHLRVHLADPTAGVGEDDHDLASLMNELAVRAASGNPSPETLRVEALQLEKARIERSIVQAKESGDGGVSSLVVERARVQAELGAAIEAALDASAPISEG
ncbi:MAG: DNA primase [Solirubrobacteraceae bacterium]